jgi:hypothetical protein
MSQTPVLRPDVDVLADIHDMIVHYPQLAHDRARMQIAVTHGHVTVTGNIKSQPAYDYLLKHLPAVEGVGSIDHSGLYHDDEIRRQIARLTPPGMFVNVEYGLVKLTGALPATLAVEDLVVNISRVPGIHKIVTAFS